MYHLYLYVSYHHLFENMIISKKKKKDKKKDTASASL